MDTQIIISFLTASVLLTIMPGPDNLLVITESITNGKRKGTALATGLSLGCIIHTIAASTGLALIIKQSDMAFNIIKYAGAAYILYIAWKAATEKVQTIDNTVKKSDKGAFSMVKKGFIMNILNPKVSLFFIAFLPQFISDNGFSITLQMLILGIIFMTQTALIFTLFAQISGNLNRYLDKPSFWNYTKWIKTSVLIIIGILLIFADK
ncbi:MAG: LysE family translocator [Bacteroidales bacterium]|nr:LysE family translocator [Bacteroidales bacterium]